MRPRARAGVQAIRAYEPVEREGLNLSDNANLFGPNPAIQQALDRLTPEDVRGYPSGYADELRARLAQRHGLAADQVVTANGSSDLIDLIIRAFAESGDGVAYHPPSFSMIPLWSRCNGCAPTPVPLGETFSLDVEGMVGAEASVAFVCRPNNPTGNAFPLEDVQAVAEGFNGLVVVDEAYVSFTEAPSAETLLDQDNVLVLRSFSKDAGLAGLRFGYGLCQEAVATELRKVRGPFRVPRPTEAVATAALDHPDHVQQLANVVRAERARVTDRVQELGLVAFPSETNFVLMESPWPGTQLARALADQGVLVRDFSEASLEACIRVTIGPPETNDTFLAALERVLDGGGP